MQNGQYPLEWIDAYVARLRSFIFVREADHLLIKVPNEAFKLNASGIHILQRLLGGESVMDLWDSHGRSPEVRKDLYAFFIGLKQMLQGCVHEKHLPKAIVRRPFSLGFNQLPVLSEIALTYRCNLKCRFCYAGCGCTQKPDHAEMTTEEAKRILRVIREDAQVPSTSFTGGEPTSRKDLSELVHYARHELGMRVNLITNGTLIGPERAAELRAAGLNSAQVSVEAPDDATHDRLTQQPGSFQRTRDGIRNLLASGIRVHTNTTINQLNIDHLNEMPGFVKGLGLERFSMNLVIPCGSSENQPSINVRYTEVAKRIPALQRAAESAGVEFMWYSPTPVCLFNPIPHGLGNKGCAACDGLLSVSPTGDVLPCSSWDEPAGNLLKEPFEQVWQSARARSIRGKECAPKACDGCDDFALCQGACPLYWNHFGTEELNGVAHVTTAG